MHSKQGFQGKCAVLEAIPTCTTIFFISFFPASLPGPRGHQSKGFAGAGETTGWGLERFDQSLPQPHLPDLGGPPGKPEDVGDGPRVARNS